MIEQACVSFMYLNDDSVSIPEAVQWDVWDDIVSICSVSKHGDRHGVMAVWFFSSAELAWLDICELLTFIGSLRHIPNDTQALTENISACFGNGRAAGKSSSLEAPLFSTKLH